MFTNRMAVSAASALFAAAAMSGLSLGAATAATSSQGQVLAQAGVNAGAMALDAHTCKGKNSCKGQGGCKTANNSCAGKNSCKGMGGCNTVVPK
ncbi:MAG: hypothetical protein ACP5O7_03370 [Phycisphaerae bacterium]